MAAGPSTWAATRTWVQALLTDPHEQDLVEPELHPIAAVALHLPVEVADYVDFYCSEHHARRVGELVRPGQDPLPPQWRHLPVGYHGRAGSVVVSGTDVRRPHGQRRGDDGPVFAPTARLDFEAEVGWWVGVPTTAGTRLSAAHLDAHVFGVSLVNDWSARDIQTWESMPLGPMLAKSFATSVAAWVTPLAALQAARVPLPEQVPTPLPHLQVDDPAGLDLNLEVSVAGSVVSRPPYASMYWSVGQMLAHLTSNGAALATGDLFASGTVSGPRADERGCLLELTSGGKEPLTLGDGTRRDFLADGDEVLITATAPSVDGGRLALGEVRGVVVPA
jgi:fumarylacetoacetase